MSDGLDIILVSHRHSREALLGNWFIGFSTLYDHTDEKKWCYSVTANMESGSPARAILQNLRVIPAQRRVAEHIGQYVNRHKQVQLDELDFGLLATVPKTFGSHRANIESHVIKIFAGMNHADIDRVQFTHYAYIERQFPLEELTRIIRIVLNPLLNHRFKYAVFDIDSRHVASMRNLVDKIYREYHRENYNCKIIQAPQYTCVDQQCESDGNRWVIWAAKWGFDLTSPSMVIPNTCFKSGSMEQTARSELIRYVTTVKTDLEPIVNCSRRVWVCPESVWQGPDGDISALVAVNLTAFGGALGSLLGSPDGNLARRGSAPDNEYLCHWYFVGTREKKSLEAWATLVERHDGAKPSYAVMDANDEQCHLPQVLPEGDIDSVLTYVKDLASKCGSHGEPFYLPLLG